MFDAILAYFADLFRRWPRPRPPVPPTPPPEPILPAETIFGIPYGPNALQTIDLYLPERLASAPVTVEAFTHGGGWRRGDAETSVYDKAIHASAKGRAFASISYRLGTDTDPVVPVWTQAQDVAAAHGWLHANLAKYACSPDKIIRVGHSAGAHLMELVCSHPDLAAMAGDYLGSVCLDSAALNVPKTMKAVPYLSADMQKLYIGAFGTPPNAGPAYEHQCDPMGQMASKQPPKLLVFSKDRGPGDETACRDYGAKAEGFGTKVTVYGASMKHGEINSLLGTPCELTDVYDAFVDGLLASA